LELDMKHITPPQRLPRSATRAGNLSRAFGLVDAHLRDALAALHSPTAPDTLRMRRAELLRCQAIGRHGPLAIREVGALLLLSALAERAESIAMRAERLNGSEVLALFLHAIDGLGGLLLAQLSSARQLYADESATIAEPAAGERVVEASSELIARLASLMSLRPWLAAQCIELFALARAFEGAADLIDEMCAMSFAAPALTAESSTVVLQMRGVA
jgi:hypothetical protein